ncbi:MAG: cupredoxin domain-containing protein [Chloroflexota bacterium]
MARGSGRWRPGGPASRYMVTAAQAAALGAGLAALAAGVIGWNAPRAAAAPAVIAAQAVATPAVAPPQTPAPPAAMAVSLTQRDISFDPKALAIPADANVRIDLANAGAAMHNFSITSRNNAGLPDLGISVDLDPGHSADVIINTPPGTYYYFCDEPGHEAAGMFGYLMVQ